MFIQNLRFLLQRLIGGNSYSKSNIFGMKISFLISKNKQVYKLKTKINLLIILFNLIKQLTEFPGFLKRRWPSHCIKIVLIRSSCGPYFPAFGVNTERYGVSLPIQYEFDKMRTRKTPNTGTFYAMSSSSKVHLHNEKPTSSQYTLPIISQEKREIKWLF